MAPIASRCVALALLLAGTLAGACTASADPPAPAGEASQPAGQATPPVVEVRLGTVESVVSLDGVVAVPPDVEVVAPAPGTLNVLKGEGPSSPGQALAMIDAADDTREVRAPVAGRIGAWSAAAGQEVTTGQPLVTLRPHGHEVVAVVEPAILYRLYDPPQRIVVKIDRGPAAFDCPLVELGANSAEIHTGDPLDAPVRLRCAVPDGVRVFPGVRANLAVLTGTASEVPVIPLTAVDGQAQHGRVTVAAPGGAPEVRRVELGLTDGHLVEVKAGLDVGERVMTVPPSVLQEQGEGGDHR